MKTCGMCREDKDGSCFYKQARSKDGLQSYCKACNTKTVRKRYISNKSYYMDKARETRQRLILWTVEYLRSHPCVDCGEGDPIVLDFDHISPDGKSWSIGEMLQRNMGRATVAAEMAKCAVRCANCHRRRTANQFGWHKALLSRPMVGATSC